MIEFFELDRVFVDTGAKSQVGIWVGVAIWPDLEEVQGSGQEQVRLLSLKEERGQRHLILCERFLPLHIPSHLKGRLNLLQIGVPSQR